jgi:nucleoside-diphosphate-sugar epimerase
MISNNTMKSFLFTGTNGFFGRNLVAALKGKHFIYGLDIVSPEKEGVIKTFSWADVGALRATPLPEFDVIIHQNCRDGACPVSTYGRCCSSGRWALSTTGVRL